MHCILAYVSICLSIPILDWVSGIQLIQPNTGSDVFTNPSLVSDGRHDDALNCSTLNG